MRRNILLLLCVAFFTEKKTTTKDQEAEIEDAWGIPLHICQIGHSTGFLFVQCFWKNCWCNYLLCRYVEGFQYLFCWYIRMPMQCLILETMQRHVGLSQPATCRQEIHVAVFICSPFVVSTRWPLHIVVLKADINTLNFGLLRDKAIWSHSWQGRGSSLNQLRMCQGKWKQQFIVSRLIWSAGMVEVKPQRKLIMLFLLFHGLKWAGPDSRGTQQGSVALLDLSIMKWTQI